MYAKLIILLCETKRERKREKKNYNFDEGGKTWWRNDRFMKRMKRKYWAACIYLSRQKLALFD